MDLSAFICTEGRCSKYFPIRSDALVALILERGIGIECRVLGCKLNKEQMDQHILSFGGINATAKNVFLKDLKQF